MPSENTTSRTFTCADMDRPLQKDDIVHIKEGTPIGHPLINPHNPQLVYGIKPSQATYPEQGEYIATGELFHCAHITDPSIQGHNPLFTPSPALIVLRKLTGRYPATAKTSKDFILICTQQIEGIIGAADPEKIEIIR